MRDSVMRDDQRSLLHASDPSTRATAFNKTILPSRFDEVKSTQYDAYGKRV